MRPHLCSAFALALVGATIWSCSAPPRPKLRRADVLRSLLQSPLNAPVGDPTPERPDEPLPPVDPPPRIAGDELVGLQLRDTDLPLALHMIAGQAGVNLYLDASLGGRVDADFPSVTLDDALTAILTQNGMRLAEDPPGVYFVELADGSQPAIGEFQLESKPAADVLESLQALVGGDAIVVADTTQNFVVVRGTQAAVEAAHRYLGKVDRLLPQVLVEVQIFEVTLEEGFELGLSGTLSGTMDGGPVEILSNLGKSGSPFSVRLQDDDADLDATFNALSSYVGLELVSSPRVLAVTNSEATIEVVEEIPYVETTTVTSGTTGGVGSTTQESVQFKEAGIRMTVTPTIQEDGTLMITMDKTLSEVADFFGGIPVLDTRRLNSRFLLRDRETVVLGGLMQDRRIKRDTGVPGLMHIPLVGHIFRGDEDEVVKRELLLFVTPRILDPEQAARLAPHFQDHFRESHSEMVGEEEEGESSTTSSEDE